MHHYIGGGDTDTGEDGGAGNAGVSGGDMGDTVPGIGRGCFMGMGEGKGIDNDIFDVPSPLSCI